MTNLGGSTTPERFLDGLLKRVGRLENSLGVIGAKITRTIDLKQRIFVGPVNPVLSLPSQVEYVWFKTDGNGNLMQTIVAKTP